MKALRVVITGLVFSFRLAAAEPGREGFLLQLETNRDVALTITGAADTYHRIEASSNLTSWQGLVTLGRTNGYVDGSTPFERQRFYRLTQVDTNSLTGDHLSTTSGDVVIHPINHATLVMNWNGLWIYSDPVGAATLYRNIPKADVILVTHEHNDHFSAATISAVKATNGLILAPRAVYNLLSSSLKVSSGILTNGASTNALGLQIEAVPAYNVPVPGTTTYHPKGTGNGYVLTLGGRRIYISGDTGDIPETRALANIDVAFLSVNLPFTMSVSNAASVAREFQPRVIYPYHYRNQNQSYSDLNALKKQVGTDRGVEVRLRSWY